MKKDPQRLAHMVQDVFSCKWMLIILDHIRQNVKRPGALEQHIEGVSTKVLNERLLKLVRFGILQKHAYAEVPPRVEYELTDFGKRFVKILDQIKELQQEVESQ